MAGLYIIYDYKRENHWYRCRVKIKKNFFFIDYSSDIFLLSSFFPLGSNPDTMKQDTIKDNKNKAGIYMWS